MISVEYKLHWLLIIVRSESDNLSHLVTKHEQLHTVFGYDTRFSGGVVDNAKLSKALITIQEANSMRHTQGIHLCHQYYKDIHI